MRTGLIGGTQADVGDSIFQISPAELGEAVAAFKQCESAGMTLTEAVRFAIRHAKPPGGTISATKAIELALESFPSLAEVSNI